MAKSILAQSGIYIITCATNGKIYVGSAVNIHNRWRNHRNSLRCGKHRNVYLQRAWNKYGEPAFTFEVLELCERNSLIVREQYWLDALQPFNRDIGHNICPTANGTKHSPETRAKISKANTGQKRTPEMRLRIGAAIKGKTLGRKRTPETRAKLSASHIGRELSAAHKANIGIGNRGKKRSPEIRAKYGECRSKNWIVINPFGEELRIRNLRQFCRERSLDSGAMVRVSRGKQTHHKGWRCKHADEFAGSAMDTEQV